MKFKIALSTLFILFIIFFTASCGLLNGDDETKKEEPAFSGKFTQIVIDDDDVDLTSLRSSIINIQGPIATVTSLAEQKSNELILGETSRTASATVKTVFDAKLASASAQYGYMVYFDGENIVLYWNDESLAELAISDFINICIEEMNMNIGVKGIISMKFFKDKEMKSEAIWSKIAVSASDELYAALRNFASGFNGTITCEWMANLWDGDTGGFYYSNSARDNEPFRPDLESTYQVISWLKANGATSDVNELFPNEIKAKIVDFAKGLQSSDGYFYHPQWPQGTDNLQTDRYGRDLSWATDLINRFTVDRDGDGVEEKQYPNFCAPSGIKCEEHAKNGGACPSATPLALRKSTSDVKTAVSKVSQSTVKPTSSVLEKPDYSSSAAFTAWLERMNADIKNKPGLPAHYICALQDEIKANGYCDELLDYLERIQDEVYEEQIKNGEKPSGLWGYEPSLSLAMAVQKYVTFFNDEKYGRPLKYYKEAISTCIDIILIDSGDNSALNTLMNQWNSVAHIMSNVKKFHKDEPELIDELYGMVRARGVELVNFISKALDEHRLGNGMFVTHHGKSMTPLYGVPVSMGVRESDVNGEILVTTLYRSVFLAFNYPVVPLCSEEDGANFVDIITDSYPIEKKPAELDIKFEEVELSMISDVSLAKATDIGSIEIVDDPQGDNGTQVLKFLSGIGSGKGDTLKVMVKQNGGNCNIIEFDLLFAESSGNGDALQFKIGDSMMLGVAKVGDYLRVRSMSDNGAASVTETLLSESRKVRADEWHRIRIEIYDVIGNDTLPRIKFFIDNECISDSSVVYLGSNIAGQEYNPTCNYVTMYSLASYETLIYLDNIYFSREIKYFEVGDDVSDMRGES